MHTFKLNRRCLDHSNVKKKIWIKQFQTCILLHTGFQFLKNKITLILTGRRAEAEK